MSKTFWLPTTQLDLFGSEPFVYHIHVSVLFYVFSPHCCCFWHRKLVKELGLEGKVSAQHASKKWDNLKRSTRYVFVVTGIKKANTKKKYNLNTSNSECKHYLVLVLIIIVCVFQDLRTPKTGSRMDRSEATAATWQFLLVIKKYDFCWYQITIGQYSRLQYRYCIESEIKMSREILTLNTPHCTFCWPLVNLPQVRKWIPICVLTCAFCQ